MGSQGRYRMHCPLQVPPGSTSVLTAGHESHEFHEGECWWFDESHEHSLRFEHPGNAPRISFYIDSVDPSLTGAGGVEMPAAEVEPLPLSAAFWQERLCRAASVEAA